jgi:hypothetical protein
MVPSGRSTPLPGPEVQQSSRARDAAPPPGAIADPPTALAGQPPPLPPSPQRSRADTRATVIFDGQKLSTSASPPVCGWTHGKADIFVDAPNNKILVSVQGLTATEVEHVDITVGTDPPAGPSPDPDPTVCPVGTTGPTPVLGGWRRRLS